MVDIVIAEMGQLSLNAISGTESGDSMRIRALVKNKVMLILVDSGSSHNFVSKEFLHQTGIQTSATTPLQVKVANGELLGSDR
jgi:predicted aspartyl protease